MLLTLIPLALAGDPLPAPTVELGGFVETYVAHNFNNPANGVTNLRGFDARSDTFALSLASVSVGLKHKFFATKVALQVGPTAASYFGAEPTTLAGFGVASTSAANLQFVREAWAGGTAPVLGGLTVEGGVFLSPVGYDSIAVKDNHFWSLSNLGVGLPFYFTGARVRQDFGQGTVLTVGVFNGWNSVVDNNKGKSVSAWATHTFNSGAKIQGLYMGGPEAAGDGPHPWRNTFDLWADVPIGPVSVIAAADGGFELREAGPQTWQAGQLAVEVRPSPVGDARRSRRHLPRARTGGPGGQHLLAGRPARQLHRFAGLQAGGSADHPAGGPPRPRLGPGVLRRGSGRAHRVQPDDDHARRDGLLRREPAAAVQELAYVLPELFACRPERGARRGGVCHVHVPGRRRAGHGDLPAGGAARARRAAVSAVGLGVLIGLYALCAGFALLAEKLP